MLTRLFTAICPRQAATVRDGSHSDEYSPTRGNENQADFPPADDTARRMREFAECCTDALAALAYAQFADVLEATRPASSRLVRNFTEETALPAGQPARSTRDAEHPRPAAIGAVAATVHDRDMRV